MNRNLVSKAEDIFSCWCARAEETGVTDQDRRCKMIELRRGKKRELATTERTQNKL